MNDAADVATEYLTPTRLPFLLGRTVFPIAIVALVSLGLAVVFALGGEGALSAAAIGVGLLLTAALVGAAWVAFGKERYELHGSFIRCQRGGLLSDQSTDLDIGNITHVKQHLPWLRFKLFGVGDILVESAGSAGSEVRLRAVADPHRLYADIRSLMQRNGFALGQNKVLHREQPDLVGVVVELLGLLVGGAATLVFFFAQFFFPSGEGTAEAPAAANDLGAALEVVFFLLSLLPIGGLVYIVLRFLDLRRRTYTIYDDAVVYEEGFLDQHNAFIPFENVADAETKRTIVDQVLGLYDVRVSCQGGGSEVKFRRLRRGQELMAAISGLVRSARDKPKPGVAQQTAGATAAVSSAMAGTAVSPKAALVAPEEAWTAELTMHLSRALLPLLPLLLLFPPAFIAAAIQAGIRSSATRYFIRESSVASVYRFLSVDEREFAYDKITGLVVQESLWDRWMGTVTVRLWSIGAPMPLSLLHIKRDQINLDALRRQVGIPEASPTPAECTTTFGMGAWLRANLGPAAFLALCTLGSVVLGILVHPGFLLWLIFAAVVAGHFVYRRFYFAAQKLTFHDGHLRAQTGRLIQRRYYVQYANVKKVVTTRYPAGDSGRVQIFVAGEQRVAAAKGGKEASGGGMLLPYSFSAHYLDDIDTWGALIDDFLLGRVPVEDRAMPAEALDRLSESQPALGNTLVRVCTLLVICFPLLVLAPLIVPWVVVSVRRKHYRAEALRVISTWGVIYKSRASVLYDRIDTLRVAQGALNKVFKNGQVTVMTAGSSKPDLVLADLPRHQAFHDVIRSHYGRKS